MVAREREVNQGYLGYVNPKPYIDPKRPYVIDRPHVIALFFLYRSVVSGRLVNAYSDRDWVLAIMFRYTLPGRGRGMMRCKWSPRYRTKDIGFRRVIQGI